MTDVQGLPEHHRAYIYARAAVLTEDTSTDALDAMVRRGFTDAEELRMRDRRYLAARGTIIERGEDLTVLDTHAEELLDHHPEGDHHTEGDHHRPRRHRASCKPRSRKRPSRTRTTSRRCAPSPRSKHRYRRRCAWPHNSAADCTDRHPQVRRHRPYPGPGSSHTGSALGRR